MLIKTVGLITYDYPHLKTEQVISRLLGKNFDLKIYALPFVAREPRQVLFMHRPNQELSIHPKIIADARGISYIKCEDDLQIDDECDVYLVLAGKILSPECVRGKKILNCHPGVIPAVRGLDAFKWAILERKPLGVTLHFIDEEVDKGEIIAVVPTFVYSGDTLEILSRRHYESELEVQCNFDNFLENPVNDFKDIEEGETHRRMGNKDETEMIQTFNEYIRVFSKA